MNSLPPAVRPRPRRPVLKRQLTGEPAQNKSDDGVVTAVARRCISAYWRPLEETRAPPPRPIPPAVPSPAECVPRLAREGRAEASTRPPGKRGSGRINLQCHGAGGVRRGREVGGGAERGPSERWAYLIPQEAESKTPFHRMLPNPKIHHSSPNATFSVNSKI